MADLIINGPGLPVRGFGGNSGFGGSSELAPFQPGQGGGFQSTLSNLLDSKPADGQHLSASPADAIADAMKRGVGAVNGDLESADAAAQAFVRGDDIAVHDVMLAMTKADTSFRFMTTVSRKVVEAYQDIMRMQV
jgi:flagellar hook-basal body complex protein FliE